MERTKLKISASRSKRQGGNAFLEAALTMVAFCGVLFGLFDVGQLLYAQETIAERARQAVRWASVTAWDSSVQSTVANMILYGRQNQQSDDNGVGIYGLNTSNVTVTRPQPDYSSADRIVVVVNPISVPTFSGGLINGTNSWPTLKVTVSQPYEVSDGSSH